MLVDLDSRGRYLIAGSNDTTVTLWETEEWTCVSSLGSHEYVSPRDYVRLLADQADETFRVSFVSDPIRACKFSHDGAYVASTSGYEIIIVRLLLLSLAFFKQS